MKIDLEQLRTTVKLIETKLTGASYAIRGTASLVLQGLDMNVDDIDILCNAETSLEVNAKLSEYLIDEVALKESTKFKSYFGKFLIDGIQVEVMGDWQIFDPKKGWSKSFDASEQYVTYVDVDGIKIPVTKVEMELEVFALMGRWTAYQKIKKQVKPTTLEQTPLFSSL